MIFIEVQLECAGVRGFVRFLIEADPVVVCQRSRLDFTSAILHTLYSVVVCPDPAVGDAS